MDGRERWQALQSRLTAARAAYEAGDRETALAEVTTALQIDPDFLAAQSLRDQILAPPEAVAPVAPAPPSASVAPGPQASSGYAKFEERTKRRRVDRRLEAARAALEGRHVEDAATALDEVFALDPDLPELGELTARLEELRRTTTISPTGPRLAAAAVFVISVLGASWLQDSTALISRPMIAAAPLVAPLTTPIVTVTEEFAVGGTAGEREAIRGPSTPADPVPDAPPARPPAEPQAPAPPETETEVVDVPVRPVVHESNIVAPIAAAVAPSVVAPTATRLLDEEMLVRQALQRYRSAYDGLDAQSAQAVWPAVNQAALARAFDGLESQSLTFDACEVSVGVELAIATCQGSARYVPKVGSREPRIEPRVWSFTLHKTATDWKIDSARAER